MKLKIAVALTVLAIMGMLAWIAKHPITEEVKAANQASDQKFIADAALNSVRATNLVFDAETLSCWAVHNDDPRPITCEIARRRMAPVMLEALKLAEKKIGHVIP